MTQQSSDVLWYLGSPYSGYPLGSEWAHCDIVIQAALLLGAGIKIFCPITHTHQIAKYLHQIPDPHQFWLDLDKCFMPFTHGLIICQLQGWQDSRGLKEEIEFFRQANKPIIHMPPGTIPSELRS